MASQIGYLFINTYCAFVVIDNSENGLQDQIYGLFQSLLLILFGFAFVFFRTVGVFKSKFDFNVGVDVKIEVLRKQYSQLKKERSSNADVVLTKWG